MDRTDLAVDPAAPSPAPEATGTLDGPTDAVAPVEEELLVEDVSIDGMCGVY